MFNPTKTNIKNEIIIYKSKLQQRYIRNNYPSIEALHYQYEPNALVFPKRIIEENKEIPLKEFIMSSKVKKTADEERKKYYPMKRHMIFKARSTLKNRVYSQDNIFMDEPKKCHRLVGSDKPTVSFYYGKPHGKNMGSNKKQNDGNNYIKEEDDKEKDNEELPVGNDGNRNVKNKESHANATGSQFHNFSHNSTITHILERKHDKSIPITLPMAITHDKVFTSQSQRNRNCKNIETLLKLKHFLGSHLDLNKQIICEFLIKNKVSSQDYYTDEKLDNLARFIRNEIEFDGSKTMKEIIAEGAEFTEDDLRHYEAIKELREKAAEEDAKMKLTGIVRKSLPKSYSTSDFHKTFHMKSSPLLSDMHEQTKVNEYKPEKPRKKLPCEYINNLQNDIEGLNKEHTTIIKNPLDRCINRMYYQVKHKRDSENLKDVAKKKNKLLEYIIFQNAQAQQQLYEDTKDFIDFS